MFQLKARHPRHAMTRLDEEGPLAHDEMRPGCPRHHQALPLIGGGAEAEPPRCSRPGPRHWFLGLHSLLTRPPGPICQAGPAVAVRVVVVARTTTGRAVVLTRRCRTCAL